VEFALEVVADAGWWPLALDVDVVGAGPFVDETPLSMERLLQRETGVGIQPAAQFGYGPQGQTNPFAYRALSTPPLPSRVAWLPPFPFSPSTNTFLFYLCATHSRVRGVEWSGVEVLARVRFSHIVPE